MRNGLERSGIRAVTIHSTGGTGLRGTLIGAVPIADMPPVIIPTVDMHIVGFLRGITRSGATAGAMHVQAAGRAPGAAGGCGRNSAADRNTIWLPTGGTTVVPAVRGSAPWSFGPIMSA